MGSDTMNDHLFSALVLFAIAFVVMTPVWVGWLRRLYPKRWPRLKMVRLHELEFTDWRFVERAADFHLIEAPLTVYVNGVLLPRGEYTIERYQVRLRTPLSDEHDWVTMIRGQYRQDIYCHHPSEYWLTVDSHWPATHPEQAGEKDA